MTAKTLPERLRHYTADTQLADNYCEDMHAAADEIDRLSKELETARKDSELAWRQVSYYAKAAGVFDR